MDISIFDYETLASNGFDVIMLHPKDGKPTDIVFNVLGYDSKELEKPRMAYMRVLKDANSDKDENVMAEKVTAAHCEFLACAVRGWSGMDENGEEVPYSHKKAVELLIRLKGFREQLDRAIMERSRLFQSTKSD